MGYQDLIAIYQEAIEEAESFENQLPWECPNDATALLNGPNGELYCPFDGWQYFLS